VRDILDAIAEVDIFIQGMDFDSFQHDIKTVKAVQLNFIIIGEAASQVPNIVQDTYPDIPWHLMRAMRNRLVHVYFAIDPQIVWDTIQHDLPPVAQHLRSLLAHTDIPDEM
jgi:uncharacterized protein with HEPN domain